MQSFSVEDYDNYSNVESNTHPAAPAAVKDDKIRNNMFMNAQKSFGFMDRVLDTILPETEAIDKPDIIRTGVALPMAILYYSALVALFVGFFYTGYTTDVSTVYLAPYTSPAPSNCRQIPISTTQTFKVDYKGNWEGNPGFSDANAVYAMELIRANLNQDMYEIMMKGFQEDVEKVSTVSTRRDLQFSQILISSFNSRWRPSSAERKNGAEGVVNFFAIGDAPYVFQSDIEGFSFFNMANASVCTPSSASASFDLGDGNFVLSFDDISVAKNFTEDDYYTDDASGRVEPCSDVFSLYDDLVSSSSNTNTPQIDFKLNVPAMTTALAINYKASELSSLTPLFDLNTRQSLWASNYDDGLFDDARRLSEVGGERRLLKEINKFKREWKKGPKGQTRSHGATKSPIEDIKALDRETNGIIDEILHKSGEGRPSASKAGISSFDDDPSSSISSSSSSYYYDDDSGGSASGDDDASSSSYYYYYYYYAPGFGEDDDDGYFTDDYSKENRYYDAYSAVGYYVDHYYDSMEPVFCVTKKQSEDSSCFMQSANVLLLPFVLNRGFGNESKSDNYIIPTSSRCQDSECTDLFASGRDVTYADAINIRYLRNSLLFLAVPFSAVLDEDYGQDVLDALVKISSTKYSDQLNTAFDIADFASIQQEYLSLYPEYFDLIVDYPKSIDPSETNTTTLREYLNASMAELFTSLDAEVLLDKGIFFININEVESTNYLNDFQGTRVNAAGQLFYHNFTGYTDPFFREKVFETIASNPPVTLVQGYMECTTPSATAVSNNLGIAFSNSSALGGFLFSLLVVIAVFYLNKKAQDTKKPYIIPKTKKHALNVLALTALMEELVAASNCDKEKCSEMIQVLVRMNPIEESEIDELVAGNEGKGKETAKTRTTSQDLLRAQMEKFNVLN